MKSFTVSKVQEILPELLAAGLRPCLIGKHGLGKTSAVYRVAEALGRKIVEIRFSELSESQLEPSQTICDGSTRWDKSYVEQIVKKSVEEGRIVFFDEITRSKLSITIVFDMLDHHRNGMFVAAFNPAEAGYSGIQLDPAQMDRFCAIQIRDDADEWIRETQPIEVVAEYIQQNPAYLSPDLKFGEPSGSPRSWSKISNSISKGISFEALEILINGLVPEEIVEDFLNFYQAFKPSSTSNSNSSTLPSLTLDVIKAFLNGASVDLGAFDPDTVLTVPQSMIDNAQVPAWPLFERFKKIQYT